MDELNKQRRAPHTRTGQSKDVTKNFRILCPLKELLAVVLLLLLGTPGFPWNKKATGALPPGLAAKD
jgi:hypothetical protein